MTEGLGDFFNLIAEDKKRKTDEFRKLVGEIDMNSIFSEVKEEIKKDKVNSAKTEKQVAAFESWLFSETEQEKEEIVAEVAEDFREEVAEDFREEVAEDFREEVESIEPEPEEEVEEESVISQSIKVLDTIKEQEDPLNDTKFATFDDLKKHYQLFLDRISVQLSSLGGGGIEDAPKTGGPYARRNQAWEVISSGGGTGIGTTGSINTSGIITATAFHGTGGTIGVTSETDKTDTALAIERNTYIRSIEPAGGVPGAYARNLLGKNEQTIELGMKGTGFINKIDLFPGSSGSVRVHHGGSSENVKLETTGYGVTVSGIASATNVSIGNTFTYPEYITGGMVPRAIKSQGGYDRTDGFADRQTATNASQDPADYIEYTQELAESDTWYRFGITTAANQANDNQWWGETNPNYDNTKGLFGGLTDPAGVNRFFDFSENTAYNNAKTSGSLKYTQALGSFSLKECQVGDLVLIRFDLNVMPMITNTTVEVGLIYSNRDENDNITFTFPLTITPSTYGSGTVGRGYLLRPTITAYMANQQDVNSRSLLAIKADNPILVNPIGVLFTIQR